MYNYVATYDFHIMYMFIVRSRTTKIIEHIIVENSKLSRFENRDGPTFSLN